MDQIQSIAHRSPKPIESVDDDDVTVAGIFHDCTQPGAVDRGPGLFVHIDPFGRDSGLGQSIDLSIQVLFDRRNPRVPQFHAPSVPIFVSVRNVWDVVLGLTYGMENQVLARSMRLLVFGVPLPRNWDDRKVGKD